LNAVKQGQLVEFDTRSDVSFAPAAVNPRSDTHAMEEFSLNLSASATVEPHLASYCLKTFIPRRSVLSSGEFQSLAGIRTPDSLN